jgi:hypothetical protein
MTTQMKLNGCEMTKMRFKEVKPRKCNHNSRKPSMCELQEHQPNCTYPNLFQQSLLIKV